MAAPPKSTLLAKVRAARSEWERTLAAVAPASAEEPGVAGDWSLKDIVAHVSWSDREIAPVFETRRMAGSALWELPLPERNAGMVAEARKKSAAVVFAEGQQAYERLLAALEALPEALLGDSGAFEGMPREWEPWQLVPGTTYGHYPQHIPDIEAWLARISRP